MSRFLRYLLPWFLAGFSVSAETPDSAPPPIRLAATLVSPHDIELEWKDSAPGAAGHVVEWTSNLKDGFVILDYLPPDQTHYAHRDLMPETTCYYRVRAYYGNPSPEVPVSLPSALTEAQYRERYAHSEDYHWAGPETIPDPSPVAKRSLRDPETRGEASPVNFKVTLMPITVSGFKLTWTDRASDEFGTMIEVKPERATAFRVRAIVQPAINSFGWAFAPPDRNALLRVRAYYFGPDSNLVHEVTGPDLASK